jgi:hypothetical protein
LKDAIEEVATKNVKPILEALFSEMTVLGFLGVVSFFITKTGAMQQVGDFVYGEGTAEAEETGELFENVHMMLFLVMVLFIFQVVALVKVRQHSLCACAHALPVCCGCIRTIVPPCANVLAPGQHTVCVCVFPNEN